MIDDKKIEDYYEKCRNHFYNCIRNDENSSLREELTADFYAIPKYCKEKRLLEQNCIETKITLLDKSGIERGYYTLILSTHDDFIDEFLVLH